MLTQPEHSEDYQASGNKLIPMIYPIVSLVMFWCYRLEGKGAMLGYIASIKDRLGVEMDLADILNLLHRFTVL
jgi:hypothetical protein